MMKRSLARKIMMSILVGAVLLGNSVVNAREILINIDKGFDEYVVERGEPSNTFLLAGNWTKDVTLTEEFSKNEIVIDGIDDYSDHLDIMGAFSYEKSEDNSIQIKGSLLSNVNVTGAFANLGDAINNKVIVNEKSNVNGDVSGGLSTHDTASGNEVLIEDSTITGDIIGGETFTGSAKNNSVIIKGDSRISGGIYGASALAGVEATGNSVVIADVKVNLEEVSLYGSDGFGIASDNTLMIKDGWRGKAAHVLNFEKINFEKVDWNETALMVETLSLDDKGTVITVETVHVAGDDNTFAPGAISTLIKADEISGEVSPDSNVNAFKGVATQYDATIEKAEDGKAINIKIADDSTATFNPQVLVIGESRAAVVAFTNQGSELIEIGIDALAREKAEKETKVFAAVYGNASEYATGSNVKVNGWSSIVGVSKTKDSGLTVGAFFENGEGNYRTYNTVNNDFMRGDGEACYNGGGLFVRKDNANGVYTEASLRAGNLQNELRNAVRGSEGLTGYDIDTFYYGAHVGVGRIIPRGNEGDSIDVYGKFIYAHHDSEDFTIDGDEFHFDSVDSERLRLGFRINEVQSNKLSMYYGAAWEYEFGGDADNTVIGYDLSTPSLGGSTVIGEVGAFYRASDKWSFDLNARVYGGQRDGFSGSIQANYAF